MHKKNILKPIRVAFVAPADVGISPGQRFRFESYLPYLDKQMFEITQYGFYSHRQWKIIYGPGRTFLKIQIVIKCLLSRLFQLPSILNSDVVYIYRECLPFGPPILEFFIAKVFSKKVVYDFDDAIWISNISEHNKYFGWIKYTNKVKYICKMVTKVTVGNEYLAEYVRNFNRNVRVIPTVVDTEKINTKKQDQNKNAASIGWTGTFTNLKHLNIVSPVLKRLQDEKLLDDVIIIADKKPDFLINKFSYFPWKRETEIQDLLRFHIGIMPLYDDPFAKGKCAFKAIQYMALGIPAVISPVGVNQELLSNSDMGYLASTEEEWYLALKELLTNTEKRIEMGARAKVHIESYYSVTSQLPAFINVLTEVT